MSGQGLAASAIGKASISGGIVVLGLAVAIATDTYPIQEGAYFLGLVLAAGFYVRASAAGDRRHVRINLGLLVLMLGLNFLYGVSNQPIGTVHSVEADLDEHVPVISEFAIPYLGLYAFVPFAIALVGAQALHRQLTTLIAALSISMAVALLTFVVFQTFVPPPNPADFGSEPFRSMMDYIENTLYAGNFYSAFPSEHCGYATILAIGVWRVTGRRLGVSAAVFAVAVILATQFLHQHFVMDAIYGVTLAVAAYAVAYLLAEGRRAPAPAPAQASEAGQISR